MNRSRRKGGRFLSFARENEKTANKRRIRKCFFNNSAAAIGADARKAKKRAAKQPLF
jgi:hypothetical protein